MLIDLRLRHVREARRFAADLFAEAGGTSPLPRFWWPAQGSEKKEADVLCRWKGRSAEHGRDEDEMRL